MGDKLRAVAIGIIGGLAIIAAVLIAFVTALESGASRSLAGPTVKIQLTNGHGSGVHIGDGYVLTAAHVVGDLDAVSVKMDDGTETVGEVLWRNVAYDVALVSIANNVPGSARLSCRQPALGEDVTASGNPNDLEFATTRGYVAAERLEQGFVALDIVASHGMSGGPLFDASGDVVGLVVAIHLTFLPGRMGPAPAPIGISYAVPGTTLCRLMGRA